MTSLLWTNNGIFYLMNSAQGSTISSVKRGKITGNPKVLVDYTFVNPSPPKHIYHFSYKILNLDVRLFQYIKQLYIYCTYNTS